MKELEEVRKARTVSMQEEEVKSDVIKVTLLRIHIIEILKQKLFLDFRKPI